MISLGFDLQEEAMLQTITQDVLKTSEIEGEHLNVDQVRSSVYARLHRDSEIGPRFFRNRSLGGIDRQTRSAGEAPRRQGTE